MTFDTQGGSSIPAITDVPSGSKISAPNTPSARSGYTFNGWYKESACVNTWNFAVDTVSADATLYAKWTGKQYTVTFDKRTGTGGTESVTATYNAAMPAAAAPVKDMYIFAGYFSADGTQYYDANMTSVRLYDRDSNTTLFAKWVLTYNPELLANLPVYNPGITLIIHETMSSVKLFILIPTISGNYSVFSSTQNGIYMNMHIVSFVDVEWTGYYYGVSWLSETIYLEAGVPYFIVIEADVYGGIFVFTCS